MIIKKKKTFKGGYTFKAAKLPCKDKLEVLSLPEKVSIPLAQGFGSALEPLVKVGDKVKAGEIIARDDNTVSSPVHASVSGKIVDIKKVNYFSRSVNMVFIESDKDDEYQKLNGYAEEWNKLPVEDLERLLYESGVTSLDREGIPTRFKSSIIPPTGVTDLIIHGAGSEPHNLSLDILLAGKNLYNFVEAVKILKKVMPEARVHIALNCEKKALIEKLNKLISDIDGIDIFPIVPKYPQGFDEVLVPTLLDKKFPYGYSAANIGIVILNVQAALQAYEAVAEGKPLIDRTVALLGPSFKENVHLKIRVGSSLDHVFKGRLDGKDARVVLNSILTGYELNDRSLPVDRTFSQLVAIPEDRERKFLEFVRPGLRTDSYSRTFLSSFLGTGKNFTTSMHGEERPCIQCGYCLEVCPVRILPAFLYRFTRLGINETLLNHKIFDCIDCGLCSYVCPSKVPLSKTIKDAKVKLIEIGCDHSLCILPKINLKGLDDYKGVKNIR